jgi:hypothetical protein
MGLQAGSHMGLQAGSHMGLQAGCHGGDTLASYDLRLTLASMSSAISNELASSAKGLTAKERSRVLPEAQGSNV